MAEVSRGGKKSKDTLFENLDYNSVLFRQLDRIGQNSNDEEQFNIGVTTLKLFASPLANETFRNSLANLQEDLNNEETGKIRKRNEYVYNQGVLAAIMKLFDDRGLLFTLYGDEEIPDIVWDDAEGGKKNDKKEKGNE